MKFLFSIITLSIILFSQLLFATEQGVTLNVDKMTCASCPYMVKKSLEKVEGVTAVSVSLEDKTATVTYDGEMASVEQLIAATTELGYPSSVSE